MLDFGFYNMDCMEGMKQFPDKYFDLAIVDPPYGINVTGTPGGVTSCSSHSVAEKMRGGTAQSVVQNRSARIGGVSLSAPKAIRRSMIAAHRTPHISPNWSEWQNTGLYSAGIISLTILGRQSV